MTKSMVVGEVLILTWTKTPDFDLMIFLLSSAVGRLPKGRGDYCAGEGNRYTATIAESVSNRQCPSDDIWIVSCLAASCSCLAASCSCCCYS